MAHVAANSGAGVCGCALLIALAFAGVALAAALDIPAADRARGG